MEKSAAPTPQHHQITLVFFTKNCRLYSKGPFWTKEVIGCFGIWPYGIFNDMGFLITWFSPSFSPSR